MLSKQIEKAQKKVEEQNFLFRKRVLEYDDVINEQRRIIYAYRDGILEGKDMGEEARERIGSVIERLVGEYMAGDRVEDWDIDGLSGALRQFFPLDLGVEGLDRERVEPGALTDQLAEAALTRYEAREAELGEELMRALERFILLEIIDERWREHLYDMDYLREGIGLRGHAQIDPLVAYKNEGYTLFEDLMNSVWSDFTRMIFNVQVTVDGQAPGAPPPGRVPAPEFAAAGSATQPGQVSYSGGRSAMGAGAMQAAAVAAGGVPGEQGLEGMDGEEQAAPVVQQRVVDSEHQVGRNDPCWCGSGKKFKKCHGS
jgi:preprotein translocase subunit SecA